MTTIDLYGLDPAISACSRPTWDEHDKMSVDLEPHFYGCDRGANDLGVRPTWEEYDHDRSRS